uniref:Transket_pyr domain-containing protein n=1 Tax=Steinernema glaseri TaxID=37863 RepID=A0A1I8AM54_9BILA
GVSAEDASGNYMYYGVREFGMTAIMNGVALHGGLVPYGATFLMFMEYARNAVRILRTTPNLDTWRPADAVESAVSWKHALERKDGPSALIFSRQNLQHQTRDAGQIADISRGGYVLKDCAGEPELILIATGSEVGLAVQAFDKLTEQGRKVRVVSMPCTSVFDAQDASYKQSVLPLQ